LDVTDVYVNYGGLNPSEPSETINNFWKDVEYHQPVIYLAGGDSLTIVTNDENLKQEIEKAWG